MNDDKKNKLKQIGVVAGGLASIGLIVGLGVYLTTEKREKKVRQEPSAKAAFGEAEKAFTVNSKSAAPDKSVWIAKSESKLVDLKKNNYDLSTKLEMTLKKLENLEKKVQEPSSNNKRDGVSANLSYASKNNESNLDSLGVPENTQLQAIPTSKAKTEEVKPELADKKNLSVPDVIHQGPRLVAVSMVPDEIKIAEPTAPTEKNTSHYIPSGAFASAVLLSGVDAPTGGQAQSNPMPVLLRLIGRGILPNFADSQIRNCHITADAAGDISSERACMRLSRLSCVLKNKNIIEVPVKGYVASEDGKACVRGKLVSKQGSMIAKAALAGTFSGMGNTISQQSQRVQSTALGAVSTIDPDKVVEAGMGQGASQAFNKIADFYMARANETYPIIEIDAFRQVEIVLLEGVDLKTAIEGNIKETK